MLTSYPRHATIHQLFAEQAAMRPHQDAVVSDGCRLTYAELDQRSTHVAGVLAGMGGGPGDLVGVCLDRCPETISVVLGILKCGAAYLPIDPSYPKPRIRLMLDDSEPRVVITERRFAPQFRGAGREILWMDAVGDAPATVRPPLKEAGPQDLAYVMYTSGSTGQPKGVCTPHRAVIRLVRNTNYARFDPFDVFLHLSPLAFDASTFEIWGSLLNGATLVTMPHGASLEGVGETIARHRVTTVFLTAALFRAMVDQHLEGLKGLSQLITGGDVVSARHVKRALEAYPGLIVVNAYGPTETTTFACCYRVNNAEAVGDRLSIGKPISNTTVYLLDESRRPVAAGTPGEIYIGGDGVAAGYLNQPNLTAKVFLPDPFSSDAGARLYGTGDRGLVRDDGNIEFLGRIDRQVKIRGFRIELEEIESALNKHPAVLDSVCVTETARSGEKQLIAYAVADPDALRRAIEDEGAFVRQRVHQWLQIYENLIYGTLDVPGCASDPRFNITGWKSSYSGADLSDEEMCEQVDQTVSRVLERSPRDVLEIGCGTGLLLFRLAPQCRRYFATDFSSAALRYVARYSLTQEYAGRLTLLQGEACDLPLPDDARFDAVILNSIVQHFPDAEYLRTVLSQAISRVHDDGFIFIGDLRSFSLLRLFYTSVELFRASEDSPASDIASVIQHRLDEEEELVIDPEFFTHAQLDKVSSITVQLKRGRHRNELTQFRYDLILHIGALSADRLRPVIYEWNERDWTPARLAAYVEQHRPLAIELRGVPNARLANEFAASQILDNPEGRPLTVAGVREEAGRAAIGAVDPEEFWSLECASGYRIEVRFSNVAPGSFNVMLVRKDFPRVTSNVPVSDVAEAGAFRLYTNEPLLPARKQEISRRLRAYLREQLPEHMVPAFVVLVDRFPLTPNGKVDVRSLPRPPQRARKGSPARVPVLSETEARLADLWEQVLDVGLIRREENFFDLGGDSLQAVRLASLIRENFGIRISPAYIFDRATLASQAELLDDRNNPARNVRAAAAIVRGEARRARITGASERR